MGIYIFNWLILWDYLVKSYVIDKLFEDFGKNVILLYLVNNEFVYVYVFKGYW